VTPAEYRRARREGRLRAGLADGHSVEPARHDADDGAVLAALRRTFPNAAMSENRDELAHNLVAVLAIVDGDDDGLTGGDATAAALPLDIRGTAFQRRVWNALRAIPSGERWSYAQVAAAIGWGIERKADLLQRERRRR
jgi:O6-methylguanine-DNA--protein-cysteine methyltransferase